MRKRKGDKKLFQKFVSLKPRDYLNKRSEDLCYVILNAGWIFLNYLSQKPLKTINPFF